MFCTNCGNRLEDGDLFCTQCGARAVWESEADKPVFGDLPSEAAEHPAAQAYQETAQQPYADAAQAYQETAQQPYAGAAQAYQETAQQAAAQGYGWQTGAPVQKKSRTGLFIAIGVVVLGLAALAVWFFFLRVKKTDLSMENYISAEFSGVDGYGEINAYLDYDALEADILKAMEIDEKAPAAKKSEALALISVFEGRLFADISKRTGLKNGDEVVVTVSVPKEIPDELRINAKQASKTFVVEGLKTVETLDPFEAVEVRFFGLSPFVSARVDRVNTSDIYYYIDYSLDRSERLSDGDKVTVTASCNEEFLRERGYEISADSREFTVTSDGAYIFDGAEISQKLITALDAKARVIRSQEAATWVSGVSLEDMSYVGYVFIKNDSFDPNYGDLPSIIALLYNTYISTDDGPLVLYEWFCYGTVLQDTNGGQYVQNIDSVATTEDYTDAGVMSTPGGVYYNVPGYATLNEAVDYLKNHYSYLDKDVFTNLSDIPERSIDWNPPKSRDYITGGDRITGVLLQRLDGLARERLAKEASDWPASLKLEDMNRIGYAFTNVDDYDPDTDDEANHIWLLYDIRLSTDDGPITCYDFFAFPNVYADEAGNLGVEDEGVIYRPVDLHSQDSYDTVQSAAGKYSLKGYSSIESMMRLFDDGECWITVTEPQTGSQGHLTDDPAGYIFPDADTVLLSEVFLRTLTDEELRYGRNEIVARHGRKFKSADLAAYFSAKQWYVPKYEPEEFDAIQDTLLNSVEQANLDLINRLESERKNN